MEPTDTAELLNRVSQKGRALGLAALSPQERVIFCLDWLDFEVVQGGLQTFYMNSAGDNAAATVDALRAAGATDCADGLRQLHAMFPGGSPAPTQAERYDQLEQLRDTHGPQFFRDWEQRLSGSFDELRDRLEVYLSTAHGKGMSA